MFRLRFANRFKADRRPSEEEVIELFGDLAGSVGKKWDFGFNIYDYWVDGVPMEVSSKGAWGHYFMSKDRKVLDKLEKICGRDLDNFQFVIYYEFRTHIIGICMYVLGTDTDWEILYQDDILIKPDTSVGMWTILENTKRFVEHMLKWVDDEYRMITRKTASRCSFRNKRAFKRYAKTFPDVSDYLKELKDSVYNQREVKTTYNKSSDSGSFTWRSHVDTHGMDKDFVLEIILKNGNAMVTLDNEMIDKFKYIDGSGDTSIKIDTYEFMKRYEKSMRKVRNHILGR